MTATTPVRPEVDIETMIDEAVPPPRCEWRTAAQDAPHGAPATIIMSLACGHTAFFCTEHAEAMKTVVYDGRANFCANTEAPHHPRMTKADPIIFRPVAS